ncbi:MAG: ABC transporter permease subunit [Deltaproteobacteria bacterium]|nr:ABC transporter permease subunit [Deltaproteobacteria bacterium]
MIGGASVLLREAHRTSRRWQTWGLRVGFTAAMFGMVLGGIQIATALSSASHLSTVGRALYWVFGWALLAFLGLMASLFGARAVQDEREEGTQELLLLTRLSPGEVLSGKLLSRLLLLLTVAAGGMPVLSLVTSMGGVSVVEVVAITSHTAVVVSVIGVVAGFFALFTRSVLLAAGMALLYGVMGFMLSAAGYALLTLDYHGFAHVSPAFGPLAADWGALLTGLAWLPAVVMTLRLGGGLFNLTASGADVRRLYTTELWAVRRLLRWGGVLLLSGLPLVGLGAPVCWYLRITNSFAAIPGAGGWVLLVAQGGIFLWITLAITLSTWVFLHLGVDLVLTFDGLFASMGARTRRSSRGLRVWTNPVAWRENRAQSLGGAFFLTLGLWGAGVFASLQSGLWIVPGGLAALGLLNGVFALGLAVWLVVRSFERERTEGTLELLLGSPLRPGQILTGKVVGASAKALALYLLTWPLLILGMPWLGTVTGTGSLSSNVLRGIASAAWFLPAFAAITLGSALLALRMRNPRSAYGAAYALLAALVLPGLGAALLRGTPALGLPLQTLVPVFTWDASWWQYLVSTGGLCLTAALLLPLLHHTVAHGR